MACSSGGCLSLSSCSAGKYTKNAVISHTTTFKYQPATLKTRALPLSSEFSKDHKALRQCMLLVQAAPLLNVSLAHAAANQAYGDASSSIPETVFQFGYLGGLIVLLGGGGFLVLRQILSRRDLELAAKELLERVRTGQATPVEYYELGAIMLRKKLFAVARKYFDQAIKKWEDDEQDLAQVYNAIGFSYFSEKKYKEAISHYEKAVALSPGYTIAWNNLGSTYEKRKDWTGALKAYQQTLQFDPRNKVALSCLKYVQEKVELYKGIPTKFD